MKDKLSPQEILENWDIFLSNIQKYVDEPRCNQLINLYSGMEEVLVTYPASNQSKYHNCFPGGYIDHVNRVVKGCLYLHKLWGLMGADVESFTLEELIFSAINHDLGKLGDENGNSYLPSTDAWRIKNLGELYTFNTDLPFMSVPDRGLYILQREGIKISQNEFIGIKTHDGLYDQANETYLKSYNPETKMRNSLPLILHQADMMAARIEFEQQHLKGGKLING